MLSSHVKRSSALWFNNKLRFWKRRLCLDKISSDWLTKVTYWNLNFLDVDNNSKCRFIDVSKDDVDKLIAQQENENTKRKTTYDLNIVLKCLREVRKEDRELEEIPTQELNLFLSEFIIPARAKKA